MSMGRNDSTVPPKRSARLAVPSQQTVRLGAWYSPDFPKFARAEEPGGIAEGLEQPPCERVMQRERWLVLKYREATQTRGVKSK